MPKPYGVGSGPGNEYSVNTCVFGSKRPIFPALNSPNQTIPSVSICMRRGKQPGVGGVNGASGRRDPAATVVQRSGAESRAAAACCQGHENQYCTWCVHGAYFAIRGMPLVAQ